MSNEESGHKLPYLLEKLIDEYKWGYAQYLPLDNLNRLLLRVGLRPIEQEMEMGISTSQEATSTYTSAEKEYMLQNSIGSSRELGQKIEDEGILDIDNAVVIAGSEKEFICLDYRENPNNPCVRAFVRESDEAIIDWRMIAPDFETFARELGLVE